MQIIVSTMPPDYAEKLSQAITREEYTESLASWINGYCNISHACSRHAGWWDRDRNFGELIALIHSEVSEAMEGGRKDKQDEHLPNRSSVAVELADAVIRIADLAGALGIPLGTVIVEKMVYNSQREDHKRETRAKAGGKQF